jgi:hypothetical protein
VIALLLLLACHDAPEPGARRAGGTGASSPVLPVLTAPPSPDGSVLLDDTVVHTVELSLSPSVADALREAPESWQSALVTIDGQRLPDVGVRLKGQGSFQPLDDKPSLKLSFDRYVDDRDLDGLDQLTLNNMGTDPSLVRERWAYEAYRRFDVPAPRTAYAELFLDGEYRGLYLMVEEVDGRFLNRWFADGDGSLWEIEDSDFTDEGIGAFDHDGGPYDPEPLEQIVEVLDDPLQWLTDAEHLLDLDQVLRYFAMSAVIGQFDAYPYSFPGDDVYVYIDPSDGRLHLIPHGGDEVFSEPERPVDFVYGRLATQCLLQPACEQQWAELVWSALAVLEADGFADEVEQAWFERRAHRNDEPEPALDANVDKTLLLTFLRHRREQLLDMPGLLSP